MNSPKKALEFSKAVLNVSTYKPHPGNELAEMQQYTSIDITDLLRENGVDEICQVNGVSAIEGEEGLVMLPTFTNPEISLLAKKISDIIDAAIVNEKQGKAIKRLVNAEFDDFISDHWAPIKKCDFVKEYVDELFKEELGAEHKDNA